MITLEQVLKAYEYANSHPHKYLRGTTNWCAAVAHSLNEQKPDAQHQGKPVAWVECSPAWLKAGGDCATASRICVGREGISHLHPAHSSAEQPAPVAVFNPERALLERWAGLRGEISLDQVYEEARSLLEKPAPTAHTMRSVMEITQEASKYYVAGTSNWCEHIAARLNGVKP